MSEETFTRTRGQYILYRWGIPLILLGGIGCLVYTITDYFDLSQTDRACGFAAAMFLAVYQFIKASILWLKLPDGTFYYSGRLNRNFQNNDSAWLTEPASYEKEFFYDKSKQPGTIALGLFLGAAGYFVLSKKDVILPLIFFIIGLQFILASVRKMLSGPVLKIAKPGIWTKGSGYLTWKSIDRIRFTEKTDQKNKLHSLELFLKDAHSEHEFPDYSLAIQDLKEEEEIKKTIIIYKPDTVVLL